MRSVFGFGVREAWMPLTAPALFAYSARETGLASFDACPSDVKPSAAIASAATPNAIGKRRFIGVSPFIRPLKFSETPSKFQGREARRGGCLVRAKCRSEIWSLCEKAGEFPSVHLS